jgi:hypothetical protein
LTYLRAPGSASFFQDGAGAWWIAYHGYGDLTGARWMVVQRVKPDATTPYLQ